MCVAKDLWKPAPGKRTGGEARASAHAPSRSPAVLGGPPVSVRRPMRRAGAPPPRPLVHLRARMLSTGRPEPRPKPRPVSGLSLGSSSTLCGRGRRLWKGGRHGLPTAWTTEGRLAAGRYSLRPRAETVERGGQRQVFPAADGGDGGKGRPAAGIPCGRGRRLWREGRRQVFPAAEGGDCGEGRPAAVTTATEGGDCGGEAGGSDCCDRGRRLWRGGWWQGCLLRPMAETVEKRLAAGGAAADGGDCGEGAGRRGCCGRRRRLWRGGPGKPQV